MIKNINGKEYQVQPDEFQIISHERYNHLSIMPEVGNLERIISILREISSHLNIKKFIHSSPLYGGFIPIQLSKYIEEVYIDSLEQSQVENTLSNIENIPNIFILPTRSNDESIMKSDESCIFYFEEKQEGVREEKKEKHIVFSHQPTNDALHITRTNLWLSIPEHLKWQFLQEFHFFMKDNNEFDYDNLIDLCMIVKNAGDTFEEILKKNMHLIDKWTILDTGSTDNTIEIINRVLVGKKRGQLFQEPFINFPESRNRCLDLAKNTCKYTLMLDDTYIVQGDLREFLNTVRGDQFATSYSLYMLSFDVEYTSNRIVKTDSNLRYIFKLHEIINPENNVNVNVPRDVVSVYDVRSDYMERRTMERKSYDVHILEQELRENPDNPRILYYLAQTYNLLKKYDIAFDYFIRRINHPNTGFIQEKYDSFFEAGRIANFQLNLPWTQCKRFYEMAFSLDNKRPESHYFIGIHYYMEGNYSEAWKYLISAYQIGYPVHSEFSLKPTLSFFYLPKYLAELCYTYAQNYSLGKEIAEYFLRNNKPVDGEGKPVIEYNTMKLWYNIFSLLERVNNKTERKRQGYHNRSNKLILTFVADGGFGTWTGRDILIKGMGGSETFIVEMARWIQKSGFFDVFVFCRCGEMDIFESVTYLPIEQYTDFISQNQVYSTVISRFLEYIPCSLITENVENVYLVLHDLVILGSIIPVHPKIKKVFCLSEWHVDHFLQTFPQFASRTMPFYYGRGNRRFPLSPSLCQKTPSLCQKTPCLCDKGREGVSEHPNFIYSSFPNRGLLPLLQMWSAIIQHFPNASLHIYSDVDGKWVNDVAREQMDKIRKLLRESTNLNIHYHGWVPKSELDEAWQRADVWFYPTTFLETFCLTALECASSKTLAITMKTGSLINTVGDRGILLEGDPMAPEWQKKTVEFIASLLTETTDTVNKLIEKNYEWSKPLTWENRAEEFIPLIFGDNTITVIKR
jgi:tetratricopeptide (TPR) repeat protein